MAKLLLLLAVIGIALWLIGSRRGARPPDSKTKGKKAAAQADAPSKMLPCSHCGVHLPQAEAVLDAGGRAYCSEAHRLAGPR